jgi:hypothetical protein
MYPLAVFSSRKLSSPFCSICEIENILAHCDMNPSLSSILWSHSLDSGKQDAAFVSKRSRNSDLWEEPFLLKTILPLKSQIVERRLVNE